MTAALLIAGLLVAAAPLNVDGTLKSAIEDFEFGEHASAEKKLYGLLNPIQLASAEDVILARQYLGACYFLLEQRQKAETEFSKILVLDPEHKLDPEVFSPALVQFFEEVRTRTGVALKKGDGGGGKVEPDKKLPDPKPSPSADLNLHPSRPPLGLAFVPFGIGQFNNRQPVKGALFLVTEGGLFGTAIATFIAFNGLGSTLPDGSFQVSPADKDRAATFQSVYLGTFYAGLGVLAIGVVEALISYPGEAADPGPGAFTSKVDAAAAFRF
ncbi:MAG: hypothetical protein U1E65_23490 [Myxococcota bacterium]